MVDEALDLMQVHFGAVRRDVARYMGRLQVGHLVTAHGGRHRCGLNLAHGV
jgi:hypothetical protein